MGEVTNRLLVAMNAHDVDAFVACFAWLPHEQPAHPIPFRGQQQGTGTGRACSPASPTSARELTVRHHRRRRRDGEWRWRELLDGEAFAMRESRCWVWTASKSAWGRLYMERSSGADIDQMVRETYRPPDTE
jgi:hypothetical protein